MQNTENTALASRPKEVNDCLAEYESRSASELPELRTLSDRVSSANQTLALAELVKADLERRWRVGLRKSVVDYLREYPELQSVAEDLSRLEDEIRLRYATQATILDPAAQAPAAEIDTARPGTVVSSKPPTAMPDATVILSGDQSSVDPAGASDRIGRYRLVEEVGTGSFGKVFRCHDDQLHRDVAVKIRHGQSTAPAGRVDEFIHEARSAARLRHPNIVAVLDTGRTPDGSVYIVYEFVAGQTLKQRMDAGPIPMEQAVEWLAEIADALHEAHKSGLVHRDIKPANILIDAAGRTKLTDFGLAKIDDQFFTDDTGRVLGTVAYMSPEQALGQSHWASPHADIYSMGVMMYELLCGRRPFKAESSLDLLEQVKHRTPAAPRTINDQIPKELENICLRAMAKQPGDRFNTAADMAEALRAAIAPKPAGGPPPRSRVGSLVVAGVAVAAICLAMFGVYESGILNGSNKTAVDLVLLSKAAPDLQLHVQRKHELDTYVIFREGIEALHSGDKLQLHATLAKPSYVYLYWVDSDGKLDRLYPKDVDPSHQKRVSEVSYPEGAEKISSDNASTFTELDDKSEPVPEMVFAAATDTPLAADKLKRFEQLRMPLDGEMISEKEPFREVYYPHAGASYAARRGLKPGTVVSRKLYAKDFETALATQFKAYHATIFLHK